MKCGSGLIRIWKSSQNKCERWPRSFDVLAEQKYRKQNFRTFAVKAEMKCGSGLTLFGRPGWTSAEDERDLRSPGRAVVWKVELQIFGSKDRAELRKQSFGPFKVLAERKCGSWTSYRWQLRQSRSVEAELHILWSPGRDEMRKWTYPYLEVLAEHVRKMNEIFRSPGWAVVRKAELQIFGSQGRAKVLKRNFTSLKVPSDIKCGNEHTRIWKSWQNKCGRWTKSFEVLGEWKNGKRNFRFLAVKTERNCASEVQTFKSPGRAEVQKLNFRSLAAKVGRKRNFTSYEELAEQRCGTDFMSHHWQSGQMEVREQNFRSLAVLSSWKCGSRTLHLWQVLNPLIATANVDE